MSLQQLTQIEWTPIFKIGGLLVAMTLGYASVDHRLDSIEKNKARVTDVKVMQNDVDHIKKAVDRIEEKIDGRHP